MLRIINFCIFIVHQQAWHAQHDVLPFQSVHLSVTLYLNKRKYCQTLHYTIW